MKLAETVLAEVYVIMVKGNVNVSVVLLVYDVNIK